MTPTLIALTLQGSRRALAVRATAAPVKEEWQISVHGPGEQPWAHIAVGLQVAVVEAAFTIAACLSCPLQWRRATALAYLSSSPRSRSLPWR